MRSSVNDAVSTAPARRPSDSSSFTSKPALQQHAAETKPAVADVRRPSQEEEFKTGRSHQVDKFPAKPSAVAMLFSSRMDDHTDQPYLDENVGERGNPPFQHQSYHPRNDVTSDHRSRSVLEEELALNYKRGPVNQQPSSQRHSSFTEERGVTDRRAEPADFIDQLPTSRRQSSYTEDREAQELGTATKVLSHQAGGSKYFPSTVIESTPDGQKEFEATIRSAGVTYVKDPEVIYQPYLHDETEALFGRQQFMAPPPQYTKAVTSYALDVSRSSARQGIRATEIDISGMIPRSGIIAPANQPVSRNKPAERNNPHDRNVSNIGSWPKELPLTAPSTTELHARIAVISSSRVAKSKLANSALKRVNESRRRSQLEAKYISRSSPTTNRRHSGSAKGIVDGIDKLLYRRDTSPHPGSPVSASVASRSGSAGREKREKETTPASQQRARQIYSSSRMIEQASQISSRYKDLGSTEFRSHAEQLLWKGSNNPKSRSVFGDQDDESCRNRSLNEGNAVGGRRSESEPRRSNTVENPWEAKALETIDRIIKQEERLSRRVCVQSK
jgi:hypothetical protein